ncbi:ABC-type lipoprotein export system ATPase subunit [Variovorax boronicumulans]|uniref:ABC-type lipoprotein export system ATPase subunit n=1 Tax=Variovorax boronicumulans TaxID=436515 RepID=A0AAW8DSM7_9BURK|nr:ABC transporter [Variovorax boronicumulans]MDP9876568.1 ABC-type lipoprotein export system ATPase subunit [Variovorax boronicumulans]MDP9922555.1 ABC-type lipoprotein export system ATPase subunit [Variovorax boronicumulans]
MLADEMIAALNAAQPAVFALMDYWTFDGWFALRRRLKEAGAPKLTKTVFPGIELRLVAPMPGRLNAHVLFSDAVADQVLHDFKAALLLEIVDRPLSDAALVSLGRAASDDKLKVHGFKRAEVDADDERALLAGSTIAEINCDSYKRAIEKVPNGHAIGFMPWDTNDGLSEVKWHEHYAYFLGLFKTSPIFESRNIDLRGAFVGEVTPGNSKYIKNFQDALGNVPRLAVSGSDAHCFVGVKGDNDKRGYGDFPSGKVTWIKADPSFHGLLQAIMEPAKRSYIGDRPQKQVEISENKTFFIDSVSITKIPGSAPNGTWLDGTSLPLNPDLVAIIGNKGSGKSALADVIALLGNSRQKTHFSFLKKDRFRGKSGDPAKHFTGTLAWLDGSKEERNLNEDPPEEKVEFVRYIPQGHFEELCNSHVSGRSNAFENELRAVIFSHTDASIRLGALDFDQLIEEQESSFRHQLNEFRKDLRRVNQEIAGYETQLQPEVRSSVQEQLTIKSRQIEEHNKIKPEAMEKPADALSVEQQQAATSLETISSQIRDLEKSAVFNSTTALVLAGKLKAVQNVRERLRLLDRAHTQFVEDTAADLTILGLQASELLTFELNQQPLDELSLSIPVEQERVTTSSRNILTEQQRLLREQAELNASLNAPQLAYQQNLKSLADWEAKLAELTGAPDAPETLKGLEARITQLDGVPQLLQAHMAHRAKLAGEIFDILDAQRKAREALFKPVQNLIQGNQLIRDEYKLQFQATLGGSADGVATSLFDLIKQNSKEFRGEDESFATVRRLAEEYDFNARADVLSFVEALHGKIVAAASTGNKNAVGIGAVLRKDKSASDVYDLLFGLSFLEPRYSLLFQDAQIEQLSPGQRGALLLIFYLLVDKGRNPIILDQPEENLDNETVVSLLVPVLTEAKKQRQIIMVTHNPNLAVVCDAEQVIWSTFDRKNASKISYLAGSIENPAINGHVVNVLEGTMPAFNNRRTKYH